MAKINRGKKFEDVVRHSFEKVSNTSVIRLPDPVMGYLGYRNICDFIVYHYPVQYFIECKSCHGASLPMDNITKNQREGLLAVNPIKGVCAGIICWYVEHDYTVFIPISVIQGYREQGWKSINYKKIAQAHGVIEIKGRKKRIFFDYDMEVFFNEV